VILLDTHSWIWWVHGDSRLPEAYREFINSSKTEGIGVSAISCWEVAMLEARGRITLPMPIGDWMRFALNVEGLLFLDLTPAIAIESTRLPGDFHRDPADQIIVATARIHSCPLITLDAKIIAYSHVLVYKSPL
jgi:PIN domain nuclease of toxin-antitoxin system